MRGGRTLPWKPITLEDSVRKFLFSPSVWSAAFGGIGVARSAKEGPRDWRLILQVIVWGATVALAVDAVRQRSLESEGY
jgi:hypothetical protein